ncbi:hypothetical protein BH20CHL4_BH20CHL4_03640 [soil metagenome]
MVTDTQRRGRIVQIALSVVLVASALAIWRAPQTPAQDAFYLGDAPVVSDLTVFIPESDVVLAADIPSVNLSNRNGSIAFYNSYYRGSGQPAIEWTGNHSTCNAGTTATGFREAVLLRMMYFRAMAGIPSSIGFSDNANAANQQGALMMSRNGMLSHNPPASWLCYTATGAQAAASSNIAIGWYGRDVIDAYMKDGGSNNAPAGHRRWLLYPQTRTFGSGDVPQASGYSAANTLWVFDSNYGSPRPFTRDGFVSWPPPGYVPFQVVYPRWSFSFPGAGFGGASVTMRLNGATIPVTIESRVNGYGENTIVWRPTSMGHNDSWLRPVADQHYSITISGVSGASSSTYTYQVTVFDPDNPDPGSTAVPSVTSTAPGGGAFSPGMMVETIANLNLRSGAATTFPSIGILPNETRGAITGNPVNNGGYSWYPVQMEGFPAGWVAGAFLRSLNITSTPAVTPSVTATRTSTAQVTATSTRTPTVVPGGFAPGTAVRTTANLRLRSGPSTSSSTLGIMSVGTIGTITGAPTVANGYTFYPVSMNGFPAGYTAGEYLEVTGPGSTASRTPTPVRTPTSTQRTSTAVPGGWVPGTAVQTTANLRLRSGPSTSSSTLAIMPLGATGTISGAPAQANGYTWYPVNMNGFPAGYTAGEFLQATGSANPTATPTPTAVSGGFPAGSIVSATFNVNVRSGPGTTNTILGLMTPGAQATVTGAPVANGGYLWHPLNVPGIGSGWVAGSFLTQVGTAGVSVAEEPALPPMQTAQIVPPTLELTAIVEAPPTDEGPRPHQIVRIQRTENSSPGAVLVDEDPATTWTAPGFPGQQVAVFVADLGAQSDVGEVRWLPGVDGMAGELYLSISNDGQEWTDIDLGLAVQDEEWTGIPVDASTQFVRFAFVDSFESPVLGGIAEIEIWP